MRVALCLLALFLSVKAFPHAEYLFTPQGSFVITIAPTGPYYFTGFHLEKANIYLSPENQCVLYGTIEKVNDPCCAYLFTVHPAGDHFSGVLSLEKYEICDPWASAAASMISGFLGSPFGRQIVGDELGIFELLHINPQGKKIFLEEAE